MRRRTASTRVRVWVVERGDRRRAGGKPVFVLRWTDPATGKRRQQNAEGTTLRLAEREAGKLSDKLTDEVRAGLVGDATGWTEFTRRYRSECVDHMKRSSKTNWATASAYLAEFAAESSDYELMKLEDVTPAMLAAFRSWLLRRERVRTLKSKEVRRRPPCSPATVEAYIRTIRAAIGWAAELQLCRPLPPQPKGRRGKRQAKNNVMRGRPLTTEEFERLLETTSKVAPKGHDGGYKFLLRVLWTGGLRISEAMVLSWDDPTLHMVMAIDSRLPKIRILCDAEKGATDRLIPMAPELVEVLRSVPRRERTGSVCKITGPRGGCSSVNYVGKQISEIGEKAGVVTQPGRHATAHDLRRSFGQRWATRVMPPILQQLMRHESIETTMSFYVGNNADVAARAVWDAWEQTPAGKEKALAGKAKRPVAGDEEKPVEDSSCDQQGDQVATGESLAVQPVVVTD